MSISRIFGNAGHEDEAQWISVSDLMAGLMVIFLFIAITYIRPILLIQNTIKEIVVTWQESEVEIYEALNSEFSDDLQKWDAVLEKETLSIRFQAPEILFDTATSNIKPEFQEILGEFFPRYLGTLYQFRESIDEIRIEGHTSSEWEGAEDSYDAYFKNMELSQARTRSVLEHGLRLQAVQKLAPWARGRLTANGLSSSNPILSEGLEDSDRSRRVEFRVRTNTKEQIVRVLETLE